MKDAVGRRADRFCRLDGRPARWTHRGL